MTKFSEKNNRGVTLLELAIGIAITGAIIWAGMAFMGQNQKRKVRTNLEIRALAEMQEFFSQLRATLVKIAPDGALLTPASNSSALSLTLNLNIRDPNTLQLLPANDRTQVLQVFCAPVPPSISPAQINSYLCPGACPPGNNLTAPVIFSKATRGSRAFFPLSIPRNSQGQPIVNFPTGNLGNEFGAILCPTLVNNQLSVRLTYLIRYNSTDDFQFKTRTELFTIPRNTGAPGPEIIGSRK